MEGETFVGSPTEGELHAALVERERCISIIYDFADVVGDAYGGKPRHALMLAVSLIENEEVESLCDCVYCVAKRNQAAWELKGGGVK
jgi:hypothetical protein